MNKYPNELGMNPKEEVNTTESIDVLR